MPSLKYWDGAVWQTLLGGPSADLSFVPLLAPAVDTRNLFLGDTAARLVLSSKVTTDTQNRLTVGADGKVSWGPGGATAVDTNLYRSAANTLKTDGALVVDGGATGARLYVGNALDVSLYRSAATVLKTDTHFAAGLNLVAQQAAVAQVWIGDRGPASQAGIAFGSASDANLYRYGAATLATSGFFFSEIATGSAALGARRTTDSGWRWYVNSDGDMWWGLAAGTYDTSLYRTAPGVLTLSGALTATGTLAGAGITDATLPARLRAVTTSVPGAGGGDCNNAVEVGWYYAGPTAANSPSASTYWAIFVINDTATTQVRQFAYDYASDVIWMRRYTAPGPWAAWVQTWPLAGTADLAYQEFIASVSISAATEATANTIVTAPAVSTDGVKAIRVEFFSPQITVPQNEIAVLWLFQDGVSIGILGYNYSTTTGGNWDTRPNLLARRLIPSAGSHTYSVRGSRNTNNATVGAGPGGAGQLTPGFIRITTA